MSKVLETNLCKINYSNSLQELSNETVKLLQDKIIEYKELFNIELDEKIIVNYFDNLEEFREFIYKIRGERKSLPKYANGTYDEGMINAYVEPDTQLKRLYTASHELFHILYAKYILKNDYSKRIVWYDEGMAQLMSGEKDKYIDEEKFKSFYLKVKEETKTIPNLNDLEHGNSFCSDEYNGYDLSYLSIKYLNEILSTEKFRQLMYDFLSIQEYGNNLIYKMFDYYDEQFKIERRKSSTY
ncbi:hypothetical protein EGW03_06750 [bacterium]|jgi:hypothetical protein|nr:hypothetical protein [bacterium]